MKTEDLIEKDPFFSQVEKTIHAFEEHGIDNARQLLGKEAINIYIRLLINRTNIDTRKL